jgi:hypothetical protein
MKILQGISFISILAALIVHGLWPEKFLIDRYSALFLFLLAIPLVASYLRKAKWFGAEFDFKETIHQVAELVQKSEIKAKEKQGGKTVTKPYFETFSVDKSLLLVSEDPSLALAALRIEIERVLSNTVKIIKSVQFVLRRGRQQ